jgi:group I intron endonuclease
MNRSAAAKCGWEKRRFNHTCRRAKWWIQAIAASKPERPGYIYLLRNKLTGEGYVGQTLGVEGRWDAHIKDALFKNSQCPIHRAIRKAFKRDGCLKNITAEVIHECGEFSLNDAETRFINELRTHVSQGGYNVTWGGDGVRGLVHTASSRDRMSKSAKKYLAENPEAAERLRKQLTERVQTQAEKDKRAATLTGKTYGPNKSWSEAAKRRWADPVYRANQATAMAKRREDPVRMAEVGSIYRAAMTRRYEDPTARAKTSISTKRSWLVADRQARGAAISAGMQEVIQTPEYRAQMARNRRGKEVSNARAS